ncbi:ABC transporter ATP-binding protein [uncultured Thiodictyon sp.]|jgi:ABC-2 type transport system ATP-binding protein|uniref:ABC transporter ATP-binding protein n=1 Tax=uncultured Thiodictyon sp. TaxID=1846217 RepID=UPI0025F6772B|nr:ABC transporter ATP-binding protein [uncultured Thiodictyon sp.]
MNRGQHPDQSNTMAPGGTDGAALEVSDIAFAYPGREVLAGVSFGVPAGGFCVLLGVNGAGKTTLFSLITRLFLCRTGSIRILGQDLSRQGPRALAALGVVFQQPTLDLDLTLRQNLRYHCALHGLDPTAMRPRIESALAGVDLAERAGERARQLSGGQRRRLELARALLHRPRVLLADEPTVGLDVHSRQAIIGQVRARCREDGVAVLWATHLVDEVEPTDQVVLLHRGRVLHRGTAARLLTDTGSASVHQAFNRLTGAQEAA